MRILFLGDVVGCSGRKAVVRYIPLLRERLSVDFVIINGENTSGGYGINVDSVHEFLDAGADVITLGNHAFRCRDVLKIIDSEKRLIRPLNIAVEAPGSGVHVFPGPDNKRIMVMNVMGRVFMSPSYGDPFAAVDQQVSIAPLGEAVDAIVIDFHCEATSEKVAMGYWCDGRVSAVLGTHTHIPTSDGRVLPGGTAYQTDVGMCGDYNSVIGMDIEVPLQRFASGFSHDRMKPALGEGTISGVLICTSDSTGLAESIHPVRAGGCLPKMMNIPGEGGEMFNLCV